MAVRRLNHAVLYVRDVATSVAFYEAALGFTVLTQQPGAAFLRASGSTNDHDLGLFGIGSGAADSGAGTTSVGLYHLAWEVETLGELGAVRERLTALGAARRPVRPRDDQVALRPRPRRARVRGVLDHPEGPAERHLDVGRRAARPRRGDREVRRRDGRRPRHQLAGGLSSDDRPGPGRVAPALVGLGEHARPRRAGRPFAVWRRPPLRRAGPAARPRRRRRPLRAARAARRRRARRRTPRPRCAACRRRGSTARCRSPSTGRPPSSTCPDLRSVLLATTSNAASARNQSKSPASFAQGEVVLDALLVHPALDGARAEVRVVRAIVSGTQSVPSCTSSS